MKKILSLLIVSCVCAVSLAQNIYVCKDGDYTTQSISEGLEIDLTSAPDSIMFVKPQIVPVVNIVYDGTAATVTIPKCLTDSLICSSGTSSNVMLTYVGVSDDIVYNVSGSSTDGSLVIKSDYKLTVNLNGVSLTSTKGEAMRFKCGKRVALVMADGSVNTFADTNDNGVTLDESDTHKACIYTKGHLEISGAGTLNVTGNYNHAIATKEYLKVKKTVTAINILAAANDAIHVGEYFQMNGGTLTIDGNTVNDGIQVEYKTDDLGEKVDDVENTGAVVINDGTINVTMSKTQDTKCIKADGDVTINGGTVLLNPTARGTRGIQADGGITITQAEDATTSITINAKGGKCTLEEDEDDPHKCMGINVNGDITIDAGTINITASGPSANGMKSSRNLIVNGGTTTIAATATSTNGMKIEGNVTFTGGTTTVTSTGKLSKGIVYSGTKSVGKGATVNASFSYKQE